MAAIKETPVITAARVKLWVLGNFVLLCCTFSLFSAGGPEKTNHFGFKPLA